jgi:thiosulfate/3-mercaptopyruvate sulfurtransferase
MRKIIVLLVAGFLGFSCTQYKIPDYSDVASCVGCHTDYAHLKEVHSPDTVAPAGGCGGEAPDIKPYDRVYLGGPGYESFRTGYHNIGCTRCHGGIDGTHEKEIAHSGSFIKHPSAQYEQKCGSCHNDIATAFNTSLHQGTGQKRKVAMRMGLTGPEEFDQLPQHQIEGYNANCATCHGTCGNCHVNRPPIAGGGLAKGHAFEKTPDMLGTCVACHTSRGGHAYLGVAPGTVADVHLTKAKFDCMDCHTGMELHGNGDNTVTHRYAYEELPQCEDCHTEIAESNSYHTKHIGDFNCQVCHSQDYNNCGSCHIHGEGARIPSYLDFKIAKNPIPETKDFAFALVRRTLSAPDSWKEYGVDEYLDFDAHPTYNFTTPHNILKITSRTDVGEGTCASKCHIYDGVTNAELYLFESDLLEWELSASAHITVDGALPARWFE